MSRAHPPRPPGCGSSPAGSSGRRSSGTGSSSGPPQRLFEQPAGVLVIEAAQKPGRTGEADVADPLAPAVFASLPGCPTLPGEGRWQPGRNPAAPAGRRTARSPRPARRARRHLQLGLEDEGRTRRVRRRRSHGRRSRARRRIPRHRSRRTRPPWIVGSRRRPDLARSPRSDRTSPSRSTPAGSSTASTPTPGAPGEPTGASCSASGASGSASTPTAICSTSAGTR
jgi:hypothetical protein